jgi:aldose 1-epimerase
MISTVDTELLLASGPHRAVVSPFGASLRRFFLVKDGAEIDLVWGYSGTNNKTGGQGDVLIPFPGRVAYGRYRFNGQEYQLPCNDKEGPNAIHGFVRSLPWSLKESSPSRATFELSFHEEEYAARGYPFTLHLVLSYSLDAGKLSCAFTVQNQGRCAAPVGVGFHPYLMVGTGTINDAEVQVPATHYLELAETLTPTGTLVPVEAIGFDADRYRRIGQTRFNHCFLNLVRDQAGFCTIPLRNPHTGQTVLVEMDASFTSFVIYTGDAIQHAPRRALAIEPMTCASDGFNHPEWGLKRLLPGEAFSGVYHITASDI